MFIQPQNTRAQNELNILKIESFAKDIHRIQYYPQMKS